MPKQSSKRAADIAGDGASRKRRRTAPRAGTSGPPRLAIQTQGLEDADRYCPLKAANRGGDLSPRTVPFIELVAATAVRDDRPAAAYPHVPESARATLPPWLLLDPPSSSPVHGSPRRCRRRRRRRRHHTAKPRISGLTRASVEALFPGAAFGHAQPLFRRGYWSVKEEQALRRRWTPQDEAALAAGGAGLTDAEVAVWKAMAHLYGCLPPDLFRYGLRYRRGAAAPPEVSRGTSASSRPEENANEGNHVAGNGMRLRSTRARCERRQNAAAASAGDEPDVDAAVVAERGFWLALLRLLPHPFFGGDVAVLRYVLQLAVMHRLGPEGHASPLAPPWSYAEPGFVRWLRDTYAARGCSRDGARGADECGNEEENNLARDIADVAQYKARTQIYRRVHMDRLSESMETWAAFGKGSCAQQQQQQQPPATYEKYLFMLQMDDLIVVSRALDDLYEKLGRPVVEEEEGEEGEDDGGSEVSVEGWGEEGLDEYAREEERLARRKRRETERQRADQTRRQQQRPPPQPQGGGPTTVSDYFQTYWSARPPAARTASDADRDALLEQKRLAVLAERREALVRHRIYTAAAAAASADGSSVAGSGCAGACVIGRAPVHLLDIPPFDPDPGYALYDKMTAPKLLAMRGLRPQPETQAWLRERLGGGAVDALAWTVCGCMAEGMAVAAAEAPEPEEAAKRLWCSASALDRAGFPGGGVVGAAGRGGSLS